MNVPGFNDREKGMEDDYIRKREAEKFAQKKGQQATPQPGGQGSGSNVQANQGGLSNQGTGQAK
ncbi:hypothetical protein PMZ80_008995 [Knufia obscura]|uniref:Uncharacterized protein n=2 Tax=Knufia TaxID=430999 RepID=A0AAN8F2B3_9EURO|nr:hypothetical protein PMZ80_008995 [Knufia obscura]KAK5955048.1 hypothetical protein OHC33_003727 [Knufia fluminis]